MGLPGLVMVGILMNLLQSLHAEDTSDVLHETHVTGVLGGEVYLGCLYTGKHNITVSSWNRMDSLRSSTKMAGFRYDGSPLQKGSFSIPASITNLTVKVSVDSLDLEGEYMCIFSSDDFDRKESLFLTVIAQPDVSIHVNEEVVDGTQYQNVICTAAHGKPLALISWEMRGSAPTTDIFSITTTNSTHSDGTGSITSLLRFPVALNSESSVSCVIQHPAWSEPNAVHVELHTFVSPLVTMEMQLTKKGGNDVVEAECRATGGRPHPHITWVLPNSADAPPNSADAPPPHSCGEGLQSVGSCRWFPPYLFEGENITCVFGYSILPAAQTRTVTLPTLYITALQLKHPSVEMNNENSSSVLTLEEGDGDVIITIEVLGNVPSYEISCSKDGGPLPENVSVSASELSIRGPTDRSLDGHYHCHASYHKHTASLQLQIQVNPRMLLPVSSPPNISLTLREEGDSIDVECLALDAFPAANVSWLLPQDLNSTVKSDITSYNSSHSVRSVLTLPACWPHDLIVQCVVEHPDIAGVESREVVFPSCVRASVMMRSRGEWENGMAYEVVECQADGVTPEATITWSADCTSGLAALGASGPQQGNGAQVRSSTRLSILSYAGCTVICVLDQDGQEEQMRRSINIPLKGPSEVHVSVGPQRDPPLWAAVCKYRGDAVIPNISWVLSNHNTTIVHPRIHIQYENITVLVTSTYEFQLHQHEGQDLTCVIANDYEEALKKTIHVPAFFISSIVLLNNTMALHRSRGQQTALQRVILQETLSHQRVVFKVNGNAPEYKFACSRADGSPVETVGTVLFFAEPVSERDAGLYRCHATWNHHKASVFIQVDVASQETPILKFIIICFCSAIAIILIMIISLCVFCKGGAGRNPSVKDRKNRESLAALMQDPRYPELKKSALAGGKAEEYAELVRYSIVIDVKSTV
ncbi:uncharacterized protein LOC143477964 isoform X2 [Brachyhypopomus gauderio]|uniref:uncharacterized protein LOC143477964 isoform X2 n=1 Tax=Brachyhypopomus gauderio TaxID=698409 RepID=UPI0040423F35